MHISLQIKINAKPEMVYAALTTPIGLNSWFAKEGAIASREGDTHEFVYVVQGEKRSMKITIEELVINQRVKWRYVDHKLPLWINTAASFSISEDGTLDFLHNDISDSFWDDPDFLQAKGTWDYILKNLKQFCESGVAHPW